MESNPKLEELLVANRKDKNNWQVYADWLIEHGEPWGEVIDTACLGKDYQSQREKVRSLLEGIDGADLTFGWGVVNKLVLAPEEFDEDEDKEDGEGEPMARVLRNLLSHPAGRLIEELELGLPPRTPGDINWHFEDVIGSMERAGPLPLLRSLDMTSNAEHMDQESWRRIGDISSLWKSAPRLQDLRLKGSSGSDGGTPIRFGGIDAPYLKSLVFISSGLNHAVPIELAAGTLPELVRLELYFGRQDYGNTCQLSMLEKLLSGENMPKLETLGIMNSEWEADLIALLADSALVKRIKHLDLSKGILFTEGAEALIANAAKLKHLESINLDENYLTEDLAARVKTALPGAEIGGQREVEDDYRYTAVGE